MVEYPLVQYSVPRVGGGGLNVCSAENRERTLYQNYEHWKYNEILGELLIVYEIRLER